MTDVLRRLLAGFRPRPSTIASSLDVPSEDQVKVVDTCVLRGWACSQYGIESIKVFVDGNQVAQFLPELERPDVALVHPNIPGSSESGFDVTIRLGSLSQGLHALDMVIQDGRGNERRYQRSLEAFSNPYHRILLETQLQCHEREDLLCSIQAGGEAPQFELWIDGRRGDDVTETVRSILAQTYPNYTYRVLEDAGAIRSLLAEGIPLYQSF